MSDGNASSRGMASGVPVPRAMGDTLRDARAEMVQASISMAPLVTGVGGDNKSSRSAVSSAGRPALKMAIGDVETRILMRGKEWW